MKKILFLNFLIPTIVLSQSDQVYIVKDTTARVKYKSLGLGFMENVPAILLSNGVVVYQGERLTLGKGSLPNGDFNYIATPSNTMEAKLKKRTRLKDIEIKEIIKKGNKKYGYKYIFKAEGNYWRFR
jgi:hypothetical protein